MKTDDEKEVRGKKKIKKGKENQGSGEREIRNRKKIRITLFI